MAKDLNTSNLSIVAEDGALKVVSLNGEARLGVVYLNGERLEGVYSELREGQLDAVSLGGAGTVEVPAGIKTRDAYLKKWSEAAQKANKAKKAGGATMLLLTLAACGGGGGGGVVAPAPKTGVIDEDGDRVDVSSSSAGAIVTVKDTADSEYTGVVINGAGSSGELVLDFENAADVVRLDAATNLGGFTTIVVKEGTVDFTALGLGVLTNDTLVIGSGAIVTFDQFQELSGVELREEATSGNLKVIVDSVSEAQAVSSSSKIEGGIDVAIDTAVGQVIATDVAGAEALADIAGFEGDFSVIDTAEALLGAEEGALNGAASVTVKDNDAGELSVERYLALKEITSDDAWAGATGSYTISDSVENLFNGNSPKAGILSILDGADGITVTGTLNKTQLDILKLYDADVEAAPFVVSLAISDTELAIGEFATVTVTFSEAIDGLSLNAFAAANGDLSDLSAPTDNADGSQTYTFKLTPKANLEDATDVVRVIADEVVDLAGNKMVADVESSNFAVDTKAPTVSAVDASGALDTTSTPEDLVISDVDGDSLTLAITYGEPMDKDHAPTIAFSPSVASTLTFDSGVWDEAGLVSEVRQNRTVFADFGHF